MTDVEIREARPEEHEEAGAATADSYREFARPGSADWEEYLEELANVAGRAERTTVLVAVEDGRILGTVTLELEDRVDAGQQSREGQPLAPHEAHVRMLGVLPEARGRGIGRRLMEECLARARAAGKTLMTLHTTRPMTIAQGMYESMGFVRTEDWVLESGFVLLSYALELGPD